MTTVVAVRKGGQVVMAADSLVTFGDTRLSHRAEKNQKLFMQSGGVEMRIADGRIDLKASFVTLDRIRQASQVFQCHRTIEMQQRHIRSLAQRSVIEGRSLFVAPRLAQHRAQVQVRIRKIRCNG